MLNPKPAPRRRSTRSLRIDEESARALQKIVEFLDCEDLSVDHTLGDAVRWSLGLPIHSRHFNHLGCASRRPIPNAASSKESHR